MVRVGGSGEFCPIVGEQCLNGRQIRRFELKIRQMPRHIVNEGGRPVQKRRFRARYIVYICSFLCGRLPVCGGRSASAARPRSLGAVPRRVRSQHSTFQRVPPDVRFMRQSSCAMKPGFNFMERGFGVMERNACAVKRAFNFMKPSANS